MKMNLYSVKDELSEFAMPIPAQDDANAKRYFRYQVESNKMMSDNPQDFSIWKVGEFDTETGTCVGNALPELIERARVKENGNSKE